VVVAQDLAQAGEGVLAELPGLLVLPQLPQGGGEVNGREKGLRVAVAQDPTAAGEGVLGELPGRFGHEAERNAEMDPLTITSP
jgi:hypothetical protein